MEGQTGGERHPSSESDSKSESVIGGRAYEEASIRTEGLLLMTQLIIPLLMELVIFLPLVILLMEGSRRTYSN